MIHLNADAEDFRVKLNPGQGIWLEVENDLGEVLVVRPVIDLATGALAVRVLDVDKEDQVPIDEVLVNFS
jgi:hypothetical protein